MMKSAIWIGIINELGGRMKLIDDKLKIVIEYREKYPEASLSELSSVMERDGIKITKSGLNHRFRKIREIIQNIENKDK